VLKINLQNESLEEMTDIETVEYLLKICGVGRWSTEYVLLRCPSRSNMFPGDDGGAGRNLQQYMGFEEKPDDEIIKRSPCGGNLMPALFIFISSSTN
jgi:3-methyladenine DNA glycosylase/8-oxoguanine DNA glycosylase